MQSVCRGTNTCTHVSENLHIHALKQSLQGECLQQISKDSLCVIQHESVVKKQFWPLRTLRVRIAPSACTVTVYGSVVIASCFLPPSCRQYQFKKQCDVLFRLIHETVRHTLTSQGRSTFGKTSFPGRYFEMVEREG